MPLLAAIVIEVTLISQVVTANYLASLAIGVVLAAVFTWLWFVIPARNRS